MVAFEVDESLRRAGTAARGLAAMLVVAGAAAWWVVAEFGGPAGWGPSRLAAAAGAFAAAPAAVLVTAARFRARRAGAGVALIAGSATVAALAAVPLVAFARTGHPLGCCCGALPAGVIVAAVLVVARAATALSALREFDAGRATRGFQLVPVHGPAGVGPRADEEVGGRGPPPPGGP